MPLQAETEYNLSIHLAEHFSFLLLPSTRALKTWSGSVLWLFFFYNQVSFYLISLFIHIYNTWRGWAKIWHRSIVLCLAILLLFLIICLHSEQNISNAEYYILIVFMYNINEIAAEIILLQLWFFRFTEFYFAFAFFHLCCCLEYNNIYATFPIWIMHCNVHNKNFRNHAFAI